MNESFYKPKRRRRRYDYFRHRIHAMLIPHYAGWSNAWMYGDTVSRFSDKSRWDDYGPINAKFGDVKKYIIARDALREYNREIW